MFLFQKGIAFQAFPLGNAILFQGNLLVVQYILGSTAVVLFATARTLVRSINQIFELANQVIWPELSHMLGLGDLTQAARLHRFAVGVTLLVSIFCVIGMAFLGKPIYSFWTHKTVILSQQLLIIFLLPIPFNAFWFTSSVVHVACNKHEGLAIRYLIATGSALVACAVLAYVLKRSILLTNDSWQGFILGVWQEKDTFFNIFNKFRNSFFKLHLK